VGTEQDDYLKKKFDHVIKIQETKKELQKVGTGA